VLRASFLGPIDSKVFRLVHGCLNPEHIADYGKGLVVGLDGVAVQTVFDPNPLLPSFHVALQGGREPAWKVAAQR
jgi:hypothetical protein